VLSIPSWLPDGRKVHGWLGEPALLGENELAGFRDTQQIFLTLVEYDDFPGALHEVSRRNPFPLRVRSRGCRWRGPGFWGLCHTSLYFPRAYADVLVPILVKMRTVFICVEESIKELLWFVNHFSAAIENFKGWPTRST
jgi:hypothetical protein